MIELNIMRVHIVTENKKKKEKLYSLILLANRWEKRKCIFDYSGDFNLRCIINGAIKKNLASCQEIVVDNSTVTK